MLHDLKADAAALADPGEPNARLLSWRARAARGELSVAVIGLGYVGIPLALIACASGFRVTGLDLDGARAATLNAGRSPIANVPCEAVRSARATGRFAATTSSDALAEVDAVLVSAPTPIGRHREPDLSAVVAAAEAIAARLRPGLLVSLESTTWPGTVEHVIKPILERSGLRSGRDFFLVFPPEREDPGLSLAETRAIPKLVGGDGPEALARALALYGAMFERVVPVSSPAVAEAAKIKENVFRAVNIGLVNELKLVYAAMGIDVWEVIEAAATKPFGFMPFKPGPGLGGHCIPVDPYYLTWRAWEFGMSTQFIELAGRINDAMHGHVAETLARALDSQQGRGFTGARVVVLGVAYKKNVDGVRSSPALHLMSLIEARGGHARYHDPLVAALDHGCVPSELVGRRSVPLTRQALAGRGSASATVVKP